MLKPAPVIWTKGTFLNPQHLQAQDAYLEALLHFKLDALVYQPWGFGRLALERHQLSGGIVQITECSGMFPDGLLFDIPTIDAAPAARDIKPYLTGDRNSALIYLTIPAYRNGAVNVCAPSATVEARYRAEFELVRDENTGKSEQPVPVARKNFRILVGDEAREAGSSLAIARVRRTAAGAFELDPDYVPPVLDFRASGLLLAIAREMVERLVARSTEIAGTRRRRNQGLADFTSSDIAHFWLLYTLNSHLPALRHFYETRGGHPEALYLELSSLAAELTTFSHELTPIDLPLYDHQDLSGCFRELRTELKRLLDTVAPRNFVALPLKPTRPSVYTTALDDPKYLASSRLYLAFASSAEKRDVIEKTPQLVKLASAGGMEHLIRQALPGIPLSHTSSPPGLIALKPGFEYFLISQSGPGWEAVRRDQNFAVYVPADFPDPELELVVVLPAGD
jgi:type VI secretion system protein ImpJ